MKLVVAVMLLAGAGWGGLKLRSYLAAQSSAERTAAAVAAAKVAWPKLARCLLGEPSAATTPSDRMRRIELALLAGKVTETSWPGRCRPAVVETIDALERLEESEAIARHQPLRRLLASERDASGGEVPSHTYLTTVGSEPPPIDTMLNVAAGLGLTGPASATNLPDPPPAASPIEVPERSLGSITGYWQRGDGTPSATVRFAYGDKEGKALACRLGGGKDGKLACSPKDQAWTNLARPLSAETPDAELWVWDVEPGPGLVRPRDGERASGPFGRHAYVRQDGSVTGLSKAEDSEDVMFARYAAESGTVETKTVTPPAGATWLGQRADVAVWLGKHDGEGDESLRPLLVQTVAPSGELEEPREVGLVPSESQQLLACRRGDWLALGVLGPLPAFGDDKDATTSIAVAFRGAKEWKPPVSVAVPLRRKRNSLDEQWRLRHACGEGSMTITWLREDSSLGQVRCTPKGCTQASSKPIEATGRIDHIDFDDLDGKVLLTTTRQAPSPLTATVRGVFYRLAPITEIATAPDQVVLGDELHGGMAKVDERLGLVVAGNTAALLVSGQEQLYAFRVDAEGKVTGLSPESL